MPLTFTDSTQLQTTPTAVLYGGSPVSFSVWMRLDAQRGWADQTSVLSCGNRSHSYIGLVADGIYFEVQTHDTVDHDVTHRPVVPTIGQTYHAAFIVGDGSYTVYINGLLVWSGSVGGTEGILSQPGAIPLMTGSYNGVTYTVADPAIWVGYRLTQADAIALRDRTKTPTQIGGAGTLKWWITLAGTGGTSPVLGDPGLTDRSASGYNITAITTIDGGSPAIAPVYQATNLTYVSPVVHSASLTPSRAGIVIFFADSLGNQVNLATLTTNPTLTTQSLNGGAPFTLTNPIWGPTPPAYQPWLYYPLSGTIAPTDTPTISAAEPWATAPQGSIASITNYAVSNPATPTILPAFSEQPKTMAVGYNAPKAPVPYSVVPVYSNIAKQTIQWDSNATLDQYGVPHSIPAGQGSKAWILGPPSDGTTNAKNFFTAPASGAWTLMWDGQATDSGTTLLTLDNGGEPSCVITHVGVDTLTGTTNNTRRYTITQNQSSFWSPTIFLFVYGRSDGGAFNPPISNIRLYGPDPTDTSVSLSDASPKFHPSYINMMTGAKCLRFSWNDVVNYSDFSPVGMLNYSVMGYPLIDACDMCNTIGADIWISLGYQATDACVTSMITFVGQNLSSGRKIWLEYSNEVWNGVFPQQAYCTTHGNAIGIGPEEWYTLRASQVHALAYGALQALTPKRGADLVRVFGAQGASAGGTTSPIITYAAANNIRIDVIAPAYYFSNFESPFYGTGGSEGSLVTAYDACNAEQVMDLGELFIRYGAYERMISDHTPFFGQGTSFPNTKVALYEGGPDMGIAATSLTGGAAVERYQIWARHPRMRGIMLYVMQKMQDLGCILFNDYLIASQGELIHGDNWEAYYSWNMKPGLGDGTDGLGVNSQYSAPATKPYQDYNRLVSVVGGAINHWNSLYIPPMTANGSGFHGLCVTLYGNATT